MNGNPMTTEIDETLQASINDLNAAIDRNLATIDTLRQQRDELETACRLVEQINRHDHSLDARTRMGVILLAAINKAEAQLCD